MEDYISVPQLVIENRAVKFLLFMLNISVIKHFFSINGCFYFLSGCYFCSQKKKNRFKYVSYTESKRQSET